MQLSIQYIEKVNQATLLSINIGYARTGHDSTFRSLAIANHSASPFQAENLFQVPPSLGYQEPTYACVGGGLAVAPDPLSRRFAARAPNGIQGTWMCPHYSPSWLVAIQVTCVPRSYIYR